MNEPELHYPAEVTAEHPYFGLTPQLVRLLWTPMLPSQTYFAATLVLIAQQNGCNSIGSGFVVQLGELPPSKPAFFIVTARHNVRPVTIRDHSVSALIMNGYDARKPVQTRTCIELPNDTWSYSDDSDVAMAPLPIDALPPDHNVVAIPQTELASRKPPVTLFQGTELKACGSWRVSQSGAIPITRTLSLATFERPTAFLEIDGAQRPVEVLIAEGTVSRGMSGGPVSVLGGGWANSGIIGLIHGFSPFSEADLAGAETKAAPDARALIFQELRQEINQVNSQLVMIIPIRDAEPLFARAGFPRK